MDEPKLARLFCTRSPDGTWDLAFLTESNARSRAQELSEAENAPELVLFS
jgi:hypothetical protein